MIIILQDLLLVLEALQYQGLQNFQTCFDFEIYDIQIQEV